MSQQQRGPRNFMMPGSGYDKKRRQNNDGQQSKNPSIDFGKLSIRFNSSNNLERKELTLVTPSYHMWQKRGQRSQQALIPETREQPSPPMPIQEEDLSTRECKSLLNNLIEMIIEGEPQSEWFSKWKSISTSHHANILNYVLSDYLHSTKVSRRKLDACSQLFTCLIKEKLLTLQHFEEGYLKFSEIWDDLIIDAPYGWKYIFKFLGPLLHLELVDFKSIWDKKWFNTECGEKFICSMIEYFTSEFGTKYMQLFWEYHALHWVMFIPEEKVAGFVSANHFEFIEDPKCVPLMLNKNKADDKMRRIKELFALSGENNDLIIDFINTNVCIDCNFVCNLTMFLCDYVVIYTPDNTSNISSAASSSSSSYKLRKDIFNEICIPLLRRCIDSKEEYELSCLNAIISGCNKLGVTSARNLICSMLTELYGQVISEETFQKWRDQLKIRKGELSTELDEYFKTCPIELSVITKEQAFKKKK